MNAFKRLLLILTSMAIMLTACGCSFESATSDDETTTPATTTTAEVTTSVAATTEVTATEATTEAEPTEVTYSEILGSVVDGVYINEYFDISIVPGSTWGFYEDSQLYSQMGISTSGKTDEEIEQALAETQVLFGAIALDLITGVNIVVEAENLTLSAAGTLYDAPTYAKASISSLEDTGYTVDDELTEVKVGSYEYCCMSATCESDGYVLEQTFLVRRVDDFMLCLIITVADIYDTTAEDVIAMISDADTPVEQPEAATTQATTTTAATTTTPATTTTAAPVEETADMHEVMGSVSNNVYTNNYMDLAFAPTDTWEFDSQQEMLDYWGIDLDIGSCTEDEYQEALSNVSLLYLMYAVDTSTNVHIDFFAANIDLTYGGSGYTLALYAKAQKESFDEYTFGDNEEITIGSHQYLCTVGSKEHEDGYIVYKTLLFREVDNYIYSMVITSFDIVDPSYEDVISYMSDAN